MSSTLSSEEYATNMKRVAKHIELKEIIEKWTKTQKVADIVKWLNDNRVLLRPTRPPPPHTVTHSLALID